MYTAKVFMRDVDILSERHFLVECFGAIDVGNRDDYHFEFHVHDCCSFSLFSVVNFIIGAQGA